METEIWTQTAAERSLQMTQEMQQVVRIAQEYGNDLAFVVNHSGGKDSTRMLGAGLQEVPRFAHLCSHG